MNHSSFLVGGVDAADAARGGGPSATPLGDTVPQPGSSGMVGLLGVEDVEPVPGEVLVDVAPRGGCPRFAWTKMF